MILIISSTRIEGLNGTYASPNLVGETDISHADVVYTNNKRIMELAKNFNVEVRDFPKHPPTGNEAKKSSTPPSPKTEDKSADVLTPIGDVLTPIGKAEEKEDKDVLTATSVPEVEPVVKKPVRKRAARKKVEPKDK